MKLTDHILLITGGTSGIGLALGRAMLKLGNTVILMGRNSQKLARLEGEGFKTLTCDLSDLAQVENSVLTIQNEFPGLDMLFNNAGVQYNYDFKNEAMPFRKIRQEIDTNLTGQILLTQLLIPLLSVNSNAFIINTTSGLGAFPKADGLVYSATKAAMRNFTIGLRYTLAETSIRVLEFIPPVTETAMTNGRSEQKMPVEELIQLILPQLEKERNILTTPRMRMFLLIAFLFPKLAHRILSK